jgi:UDP-N-acetylglucosamine 2-epimerase (non-hydrolysing)
VTEKCDSKQTFVERQAKTRKIRGFAMLRKCVSLEQILVIVQILHVVGARPNFVKIAPIYMQMAKNSAVHQALVHTGQHYDREMSSIFFEEFGLPDPAFNLGVGSGGHGQQIGRIMVELEPLLEELHPDWLVVVGDVNSTVAAALVAAKLGIRVAHVEAGLRSFDRTMPEEVNRLVTDQLADLLLTPSRDADANLVREGIDASKIEFVGNVMIDTLVHLQPRTERQWPGLRDRLGIDGDYGLVTLHRPSNVDRPETLGEILTALEQVGRRMPMLFPIHPRTRRRMEEFSLDVRGAGGLRIMEPLGYVDFMALTSHARLVVTDSGGIQEETTYLGIPCLTVRPNTERPITVTAGTNQLVESRRDTIVSVVEAVLNGGRQARFAPPELWDGAAASRIVSTLAQAM